MLLRRRREILHFKAIKVSESLLFSFHFLFTRRLARLLFGLWGKGAKDSLGAFVCVCGGGGHGPFAPPGSTSVTGSVATGSIVPSSVDTGSVVRGSVLLVQLSLARLLLGK